ncbi:LysR family transcriptional regulator [Albidovulum sp.]|uniref:LysR family transcriptional regulator n=1 Tax=Albidovulum sp. TaxID=1872424 RepID=UPI0039B8A378
MTTLRQLRYFTAVAQTGSATRAAALLNVSQPSISAAIRELEADLGQALFLRRQALGLDLTPFGADKVREAREILARVEAMTDAGGKGARNRLVLGYFATLGPIWIPGIVGHLGAVLPDTELDLRECDLEGIARFLSTGVIDCALSYDVGLPPGTERAVLAELLPHAVLPAGHPLAGRESVSLAELAEHDFVLIDLPLSREFLMVPFWQRGLSPRIRLKTRSIEMARRMVAAGQGVSLLVTPASGGDASHPLPIVFRPLRDEMPSQRLVFAHAPAAPPNPALKAAAEAIGDYFAAGAAGR